MIGGIGRHTYLMYSALKDNDLLFFSPMDNALPRHVRIRFWPVRIIKQVGVSIWLHLNAARIIVDYRLDGLNIHAGAGGILLARQAPVPVVVTCHHTYRQQCRHLRSQFWKQIFVPFEKRCYRLATRIIAVSEDTKRSLVDDYGIPDEKITIIHNAVDAGRFHPLGTEKIPHSILYVGRIARRKGIDFLIRSIPLVVQRIPEARLLVGGKGGYLAKMKALVRSLNLERHVTFLGFVPDDRLNDLYNRVECMVVPSVFEGFGITVIEALAAGTRVVGTDSDGIRGILQNGASGRLVPYGDHRALADAIVAELENPLAPRDLAPEYRVEEFRHRYLEELGLAIPPWDERPA